MENFNKKEPPKKLNYIKNIVLSVLATFMVAKTQGQPNQLQRIPTPKKAPVEIIFEETTTNPDSVYHNEYDKEPDIGVNQEELIEQMLKEELEKIRQAGAILTEQEISRIKQEIIDKLKNPTL